MMWGASLCGGFSLPCDSEFVLGGGQVALGAVPEHPGLPETGAPQG